MNKSPNFFVFVCLLKQIQIQRAYSKKGQEKSFGSLKKKERKYSSFHKNTAQTLDSQNKLTDINKDTEGINTFSAWVDIVFPSLR